ncbi:glycosyltransferase family 2 protein [Pseudomonadota bacterium]
MEFSIVVPVYNEAGNIRPLVEEICTALAGRDGWELLYVNDGSDDGTRGELYQAQADYPGLRVLQHSQRSGQSSALLTGVRAARAPWIITLDGDGQNDPADIPLLIDRLAMENASPTGIMLAGHRTRRRDNLLKRLSSRVANAVRSCLLKDATPDTGCGLKLFPRALFLALPAFDHMHRFLPALMQRQGAHVLSVPVRHRSRERGVSKYGVHNRLWVGLVDMAGVLWLQHRRLGRGAAPDGWCAQICDGFGVSWLQRRPCVVNAKEESLHV